MPAVSKKQQRFMGMVHAIQKGELDPDSVSPKMRQVANTMKYKDVKDFAETKYKGLPMKKAEFILHKLSAISMEQAEASLSQHNQKMYRASKEYIRKRLADEVKLQPNEYVTPSAHLEKNAIKFKIPSFNTGIGKAKKILTGQTVRKLGIGFAAGALATNLATAVTYPLDTAQIRKQTGLPPAQGLPELYQGVGPKIQKNVLFGGLSFAGVKALENFAKRKKWIT